MDQDNTPKQGDFTAQFQLSSGIINIDSNGDLTLAVHQGDDAKTFRVSSQVMRLASPVWRAMLDPERGFKEALTRNEPITLHDDNIEAVFLVLLMSHLRFQHIPGTLGFKQMVNLCMVCDKYDCVSILRPWLSRWISPLLAHVNQVGYEDWVVIAWVVGDTETFKRVTDQLILTCKTNDSNQCLNSSGAIFDPALPPGFAGK